jgi:hypothetical protein
MPAPFRPHAEPLEDRCLLDAAPFQSLPIVPVIDGAMQAHLQSVLAYGAQRGNRPDVFAKVGDSITYSPYFLDALGLPSYDPTNPAVTGSNTYLAATIDFFRVQTVDVTGSNSFDRTSVASHGGWKTTDLLNPLTQPLLNELLATRPAFALIMIGTNEAANLQDAAGYQTRLIQVVQTTLNLGVIPVLSTIPDLLINGGASEAGVPIYNQIIANVAAAFDVPLWNYWAALQSLPGKGLDGTGVHPNTDPQGTGLLTSAALQYGFNVRNLTALEVLNELRRAVLRDETPEPPSAAITSFVTRLYEALLQRPPDAAGLAAFAGLIQDGAAPETVVQSLWQSAEHRTLEIDSYYATYLHRPADPAGLAYWLEVFQQGATELTVQKDFLNSTEYLQAHTTPASYLAGVYQDVLGHAPTADVENSWGPRVENAEGRRGLVQALLTSAEEETQLVDEDYRAFLGRGADTAGARYWTDLLSRGLATPESLAVAILDSDEFWMGE